MHLDMGSNAVVISDNAHMLSLQLLNLRKRQTDRQNDVKSQAHVAKNPLDFCS